MKNGNRIKWFSLIFTIGIVFYHYRYQIPNISFISALDNKIVVLFQFILDRLGYICMAFFFFFSAFWFYGKGFDGSLKCIFGKWKKRLRTLLVPYIAWTIIVALVLLIQGNNSWVSRGVIANILFRPVVGPLWYLLALILMQLIAPIFIVTKNKTVNKIIIFLLAIFFTLRNMGFIPVLVNPGEWWWYNNMLYYAPIYLIGTYLGMYHSDIVTKYEPTKKMAIFGIISVVVLAAIGYKYRSMLYILILPMLVSIWIASFVVKRHGNIPNWLDSNFYIYALHQPLIIPLVDWITEKLMYGIKIPGFVWIGMRIIQVCIVVVICCLIRIFVKRFFGKKTDNLLTGGR
jgi:surface polysaccharide O-acyltransferase-like enzyme